MKYVIVCLLSLFLGFGLKTILSSGNELDQVEMMEDQIEELENYQTKNEEQKLDLKKELKEITVRDFIEFKNLKEQRLKFEKANEIFGKVMMLFLAYLDLKQLQPNVEKFVAENNQLSIGEKNKLEVIVDPYKSAPQCPICPEVKKIKVKKEILIFKNLKEANDFLQFKDQLKSNSVLLKNIDHDIFADFWSKEFFSGDLQPMFVSHVKDYLGEYDVIFRNTGGLEERGKLRLSLSSDSKNHGVKINVDLHSLADSIQVAIRGIFKAEHPEQHSSTPDGRCRGFHLDSYPYEIYLMNLKFHSGSLIGKLISNTNANKAESGKFTQSYFFAQKINAKSGKSTYGRQ